MLLCDKPRGTLGGGADTAQEILNLQTDTLGSWNVGPLLAA